MKDFSGSEKRKADRLRANFTLTCKVNTPLNMHVSFGIGKELDALMFDLSALGMAILTSVDIPVSTEIEIKFTLINLSADEENRVKTMNIFGIVCSNTKVSKEEYRLGIKFNRLSEEDKKLISQFVEENGLS